MAAQIWQPGMTTPEGTVVRPLSLAAALFEAVKNGGFETGSLSDWTEVKTGTGTTTVVGTLPYVGTKHAKWVGSSGGASVVLKNGAASDVVPGQGITVKAAVYCDNVTGSDNKASVRVYWLDASNAVLGFAESEISTKKAWTIATVSASAPSGTAHAQAAVWMSANASGSVYADAVSWTTANQAAATVGFVYKATQTGNGITGAAEPTWPTSGTVTDNTVTWTAVAASYVEWTASPIMVSGATEPTWPTEIGAAVSDGTITWTCSSRRVTDAKCPNSKTVAIMASKVFAADKDLIRFSATINPMDWTSDNDAGYLPSGLQQSNADGMLVLQPYRGNLTAFNPSCFQMWRADPDPAVMTLLDQMDGVGSTNTLSACNVGNDLFYLAALGVRSIGIAIASQNMQAGDVGAPIDPLVRETVALAVDPPLAAYYPSAGQYWLAINTTNTGDNHGDNVRAGACTVFVYSISHDGGRWSRYEYPYCIDEFAQLGDDLYFRSGRSVMRVDDSLVADAAGPSDTVPFTGTVQWPWIDMSAIGTTKLLRGVDIVASGKPRFSVGFDQGNQAAFTPPYALPADTLTGGIIPFALKAPSFSVKLDFDAGYAWSVKSVVMYINDTKGQP